MKGPAVLVIGLALTACRASQGPSTGLDDLLSAAEGGNAARVRQILENNPGLARADFEGSSSGPVRGAAKAGSLEVVRLLIEAGANPRERDVYGNTPLHVAKSPEVAGLLLDHAVSPDIRSNSGQTPLMQATGAPSVVERLLQAGAHPNLRDVDGHTALQRAVGLVGMEQLTSIVTLCAYGADPLIQDEKGVTASALARKSATEKLGLPAQNAVMADLLAPGGACFALAERPVQERATAEERAAVLLDARCRVTTDAWACARMGWNYEHGEGVTKDLPRSAKLYEQSCEHGHAWGCYALAYACAHGIGLPQDGTRATELFRRGCDGGYEESCGQLAHRLQLGIAIARDEAAAVPLFERACKGGDTWSCWQLGEALAEGRGTARNAGRASELRQQACTAGEKRACGPASR